MGKQLSIVKIRGKVGDVVGMKNGFGTSDLAFIRKKADVVTNPQTSAQMLQRVKMLPAVLFRRQLEEVIRRAWQGKKYGGQSMREFMRYAMTEPLENIPQLEKDSVLAIPGEYLIAKGSLAPIQANFLESGALVLNVTAAEGFTPTIGDITANLISQGFAKEGDQVTIILCSRLASPASAYPRYHIISFYADSSSVESIASQLAVANVDLVRYPSGSLAFETLNDNYVILGGAVVISRDGVTPLRSTARFAVNKNALAGYFASSVLSNVTESYRLSQNIARVNNNDWPYEDTPEEESAADGQIRIAVSANPSNGGSVTGAGSYDPEAQVSLTATAASNYTFDGWYENGTRISTTSTLSFTASVNRTLVAKFKANAPSEDIPGEDRP